MGTSASNNGPKKNASLLPSWASTSDEGSSESSIQNNGNENLTLSNDSQNTGNWGVAKGALSRYANGTNGSSLRKASRSYVKALGGSSKATKSAVKGISVGSSFFNFIGGVSKNGLNGTLEQFGLSDFIGKSSEVILAKIADKIAPIGSTNDEVTAREAILDTIDFLYEKLLMDGRDLDSLNSLDEQTSKELLVEYVSTYIYKKWIYEVGLAIEKNLLSERQAIELEREMKIFVKDETKSSFQNSNFNSINLSDGEGKKIIENIFELAYSTISK